MEIVLAGYNVDIEELKKDGTLSTSSLTPETISASYARISRDPDSIPKLREKARGEIENARKTNENIIYSMGHKSIAEHAVFNIDIMGISRRAVEEIEKKRLQSYTEKSQRYVTFKKDSVIPQEIKNTPLEREFSQLTEMQNNFYIQNLEEIIKWHISQNPEADLSIKREKDRIEGYGKEDARYSLSMATETQLGLTSSGRNLERLITELRSSESEEVRTIGEGINKVVEGIAPSLVKYTAPTDYYKKTRKELRNYINGIFKGESGNNLLEILHNVPIQPKLRTGNINMFTNLRRDDSIVAGIIFSSTNLSFQGCLNLVSPYLLKEEVKEEILKIADKYQEVHDSKLREYELGDRIAEIKMSSSAFAQTKRHRMNTLISQDYNINLSEAYSVIPKSIEKTNLSKELKSIIAKSSHLYQKMLFQGLPTIVAEYALTNAHIRRVLLDANNRQIHAICAERENKAAQWEIRGLANELHSLAQKESPLTTKYLCGKDKFEEIKKKRYY